MAKPSITDARSITADLILEVGKYYSAQQLRSLQAKLSGTAREIRALTSGCHLPRRIGAQLSIEQIQLLQDAAKLIESVNSNIKHAKEKRGRVESQAKVRQQARYAEAKRLVAETYLKPFVSEPADLEPLLEILKTALTLNRADVFRNGLSPRDFNLILREYLLPARTRKLIGWSSPSAFWIHTRQGEVLARGNGVAGDRESEGSPRQNAGLTNSKRIEAALRGEGACFPKAQYLHGTLRRRSDRHKQEGRANYPGRSARLPQCYRASRGDGMSVQKSAEAVVSGE